MTGRIFAITTHHEHSEEAAEEWKRLRICAIGWSPINFAKCRSIIDIRKRLRREGYDTRYADEIWCFLKEISKDDIVLAYARKNTIAYMGTVKGRCRFNQDNIIGDPELKYDYPNQRRVNWWDEPHHFDRHDLPPYFANQFGKRGVTVKEIVPGIKGFEGFVKIVKDCAKSGSKLSGMNEDMVKAGLIKHLHRSLDKLEPGLRVIRPEFAIGKRKRPDFIAKDKRGRIILIECKGTAGEDAVDQIKLYEKMYGKGTAPRLMIIAFKINDACRLAARKAGNIELVECDLDFKEIKNISP